MTPTPSPASQALREDAERPVTRAEVRDCIGPTIPLRRRWVDKLMVGPIARLEGQIATLQSTLAAEQAARVEAEREHAEDLAAWDAVSGAIQVELHTAQAALATAAEENAKLRAALEPFAKTAESLAVSHVSRVEVPAIDLRRARAALTPKGGA